MKNTVTLDRAEELAALFGEGFKLILANGQEITIRAEGEIIKMDGKFIVLMLDVQGSPETLQAAMRELKDFVSKRLDGKPEELPPPAMPENIAPAPTRPAPAKLAARSKGPREGD